MEKSSAEKPRLGHMVTPGLNNTIIKTRLIFHPSTQQTFIEDVPVPVDTKMTRAGPCPKTPKHLPEGGWECRERAANPGGGLFQSRRPFPAGSLGQV